MTWPAFVLRWFRRRKPRHSADRRPCAQCGRVVAHTTHGRAYVHRCRVDILGGGQ